jgi:hypothetical protein
MLKKASAQNALFVRDNSVSMQRLPSWKPPPFGLRFYVSYPRLFDTPAI